MPKSPPDVLYAAAEQMRADAQDALDEMHAHPGPWNISLGDVEAFQQGVADVLGDGIGRYVATWHPGMALVVAEWLDAVRQNWTAYEPATAVGDARATEMAAAVMTASCYVDAAAMAAPLTYRKIHRC